MSKKVDTIITLGGHSALEICHGAKKKHFKTIVICQKGREKTYSKYYKNLVDEVVLLDHFKQLTDKRTMDILKEKELIFIPHRYCQTYCDLNLLENGFNIPVFGNKHLLKYEERTGKFNQYQLLSKSGINYPLQYNNPKDIDRLVFIKVNEAVRGYERAFFFADNYREYLRNSHNLIRKGIIKESDLNVAVIEEYILGAYVNFNFFYSPLSHSLHLIGTDMRRQTNIEGIVIIPADEQMGLLKYIKPSYIETGHIAVTVKESLIEKVYELGENFVKTTQKEVPPGIIGPFALQAAISAGPPKEKIVVFDLSLRIPGSPGISYTPYSKYLYGKDISMGERIAMEVDKANMSKQINRIST